MRLHNVARFFNNTPYFDSYSGEELGKGQLDVYDDSKRDGMTIQRRIFEVAPGSRMPDREVISFSDHQWLVGYKETDLFKGEPIREKFVCHQAEAVAKVYNLADALSVAPTPLSAYAARVWVKTASEIEVGSDRFDQLQIFFTRSENIAAKQLIEILGNWYVTTETYPSAAGHQVALSEEIDNDPIVDAVITKTIINPVTELEQEINTQVRLVLFRWQTNFKYLSEDSTTFKRGDIQAASLTNIGNNTDIAINGNTWFVVNGYWDEGVYMLQLRRRS